jgi:diadenosine tetraphosphate (Ap4A) HIT family hydrolase
MLAPWSELRLGRGCPLCAPRPAVNDYTYFVSKLTVSSLYVARNQAYRGTCTLVYDPAHVTRPSELDVAAWRQFSVDIWTAEAAISRAVQPDHINVQCLGNTVPHLHAIIVPRYRSDPQWGHPIWTASGERSGSAPMNDEGCERLARLLRQEIGNAAV